MLPGPIKLDRRAATVFMRAMADQISDGTGNRLSSAFAMAG